MKKFWMILAALLLVCAPVLAGTHYNETVNVTTEANTKGQIIYHGTVTFADSASGAIYYTQAMWIGGCNVNNLYGYLVCSEVGTEDVDVTLEYSRDLVTWVAGSEVKNAQGTTATFDTLNIIAGAKQLPYLVFPWVRWKFLAGSTMSTNEMVLTWVVTATKPEGLKQTIMGKKANKQ